MQAGGKDNLFIMTVTEHKCLATVLNYAPVPEMDARLDGARCIMAVKEKPPKITTETVTWHGVAGNVGLEEDYIFNKNDISTIYNLNGQIVEKTTPNRLYIVQLKNKSFIKLFIAE